MSLNKSFRQNHPNKERFDRFEGATSNFYINDGIIQLKESTNPQAQWKNLKVKQANINQFNKSAFYSYSLYSISIKDLQETEVFRIDTRMRSFGSHFLMIRNPGEFINRISSYLERNNYKYQFDYVVYYDTKENKTDLNPFYKPDIFKHQKEFRIIVEAKTDVNLRFSIDSLEAFADIFPTGNLENFLLRL